MLSNVQYKVTDRSESAQYFSLQEVTLSVTGLVLKTDTAVVAPVSFDTDLNS